MGQPGQGVTAISAIRTPSAILQVSQNVTILMIAAGYYGYFDWQDSRY